MLMRYYLTALAKYKINAKGESELEVLPATPDARIERSRARNAIISY
jgi:hypothetical protein